ncbi:ComEC/Rec2 family competence protein [Daejeonella lutea]|uniref:Competence protein ComEC n=1 Tax=Daejeonella lutea TaxID=572036 RepID=A0A1T5B4K8_9SPHI|nr:ComEC/Rec2 family competence protein [Daejeonella lutea]SKB42156.1 competence protein ComEC [Daejeonella lutea]
MFYKGEIPFVRLIIPLIIGILIAYRFTGALTFYVSPILALAVFLLLLILIVYYKMLALYRYKWLLGLTVHILIIIAAYWLTVRASEKYSANYFTLHSADAYVVEVKNEPKITGAVSRFEARVLFSLGQNEYRAATGKVMVSIKAGNKQERTLKYGDLLLIPAALDSIDPPYNPGEFDYRGYLADRQIHQQLFLQGDEYYLVNHSQGNPLISFALDLRKHLVDKFYRYLPDQNAAAFASTLILGYRAELSSEIIEAYSKTGTMHVLSVSGMHVGIVFMVLSVALRFMSKTQTTRLIRAFLIITVIWFYALITGFSAPASRAAVMLSFVVIGKALNKSQNTYNLIAISAFFLLIYNPFYLVDAGFQLSYLAVAGIVYFHPKIYQLFEIKTKALDYIWSYSALSLAAQIATFPISVYYFHQFPVYFLLSNLLIVLPIAIIMYSGILFMFIPNSVVLIYAGKILSLLINFTNEILYYIENLPFSSLDGIWITATECFLICLLLILISIRLSLNVRNMNLPIALLLLVLTLNICRESISNFTQQRIIFYNLKKKSGIAFVTRSRSIIISDINPGEKLLNFSLLPAVKSFGSGQERFYNESESFSTHDYFGTSNFYQFGRIRIIKWDKNFDGRSFSHGLAADIVLISNNPNISLNQIASYLTFKKIVIDATNPDYKIKRWIAEANKHGYKYYVLKKNPALVLNL